MKVLYAKLVLTLLLSLLCSPACADHKSKGEAAMISVGENLSYQRGTARAKEEFLEFPYYHRNAGNKPFWASVVHLENGGARLICKAEEAQGKKDKSGQLANQDFPKGHAFHKTLDLIKEDAFFNHLKLLQAEKNLKEEGWSVLADGSAVNRVFYRNSKGQWFCFLGVQEEGKKTISGPLVVSFLRTEKGPVFSTLNPASKTWSPAQLLDIRQHAPALRALEFIENRNGF